MDHPEKLVYQVQLGHKEILAFLGTEVILVHRCVCFLLAGLYKCACCRDRLVIKGQTDLQVHQDLMGHQDPRVLLGRKVNLANVEDKESVVVLDQLGQLVETAMMVIQVLLDLMEIMVYLYVTF